MEDGLDIPRFLRVGIPLAEGGGGTVEERAQAWRDIPLSTVAETGSTMNETTRRAYAQQKEERRLKQAASLQRLKDNHPGEHYDRKLRQWVSDAEAEQIKQLRGS